MLQPKLRSRLIPRVASVLLATPLVGGGPVPPAYDYLANDSAELATYLALSDATLSNKVIALADGTFTAPDMSNRSFSSPLTIVSLNTNTYGGGATLSGWSWVDSTNISLVHVNVHREFVFGVSSPSNGHLYIDGCTNPRVHRCHIYGDTFPLYTEYDDPSVPGVIGGFVDWQQDTTFYRSYRRPRAQDNFFGISNTGDENVNAQFTENRISYCYSGIRCKYTEGSVVQANFVGPFYNTGIQNAGDPINNIYTMWNFVYGGLASDEDYGNFNAYEANYETVYTDSSDGFNVYQSFDPSGQSQWAQNTNLSMYAEIEVGSGRNTRLRVEFVGAGVTYDSDPITNTGGQYVPVSIENITRPAGVTAIRLGIYNEAGSGQAKMRHMFMGSRNYGPHSSLYAFTPGTKTFAYTNINYLANVGTATTLRGDHSFMKLDDLTGIGSYVQCSMRCNIGESHANIGMEICNPDDCVVENNLMFSTRTGDTPGFRFTDESSSGSRDPSRYANNVMGLNVIVDSAFTVNLVNNFVATIGGAGDNSFAAAFVGPISEHEVVTDVFTKFAPKPGGPLASAKPVMGPINSGVAIWPADFLTAPAVGTFNDDQPDMLLINNVVDAPLESTVTSNTATFIGNTSPTLLELVSAGFQYSKNGGGWSTADTTFNADDTIAFQTTTNDVENDVKNLEFDVGGVRYTWSVENEGTYIQTKARFDAGSTTKYTGPKMMEEVDHFLAVGTINFDVSVSGTVRPLDFGGRIYWERLSSGNVRISIQRFNGAGIFMAGTQVTIPSAMPTLGIDYHWCLTINNNDAEGRVATMEINGVLYDLFSISGPAPGTDGNLYTDGSTVGIGSNAGGTSLKLIGTYADVWISSVLLPYSDFFDSVTDEPLNLGGLTRGEIYISSSAHWLTGVHGGTRPDTFTSVGLSIDP